MRNKISLRIRVNVTLTLMTFGILVMFLIVLPAFFVIDVISFISSGTSIFFPSTNFLWFMPKQIAVLPLNLGQFLDVWVIIVILFQIAASLYVVLSRFFRYQPASDDIPIDVKKKFGDSLPNFMRWNILPHGQLCLGEKPENGKFGQKRFATNYQNFQGTSSEEQVLLFEKRGYRFHRPFLKLSQIKSWQLNSGNNIGLWHPHLLDCNILVYHFGRSVPAPYECHVSNSPLILASSCFSFDCISTQNLEVMVKYAVLDW